MRKRQTLVFLMLVVCGVVAGCAIPHTNTLVFGTNTKVGIDAAASPASGGTPSITVGYKRQEGVWMPLLANQANNSGEQVPGRCGASDQAGCMFRAESEQDAYSVLASFGLEFSAQGTAGEVGTSGGIAQYFATGLAAQTLALSGSELVSTVRPKIDEQEVQRLLSQLESTHESNVEVIIKCLDQDGDNKIDTNGSATLLKDSMFEDNETIKSDLADSKSIDEVRVFLNKSRYKTRTSQLAENARKNNCG